MTDGGDLSFFLEENIRDVIYNKRLAHIAALDSAFRYNSFSQIDAISIREFVDAVYWFTLNRPADDEGLIHHMNALTSREVDRVGLVLRIRCSPEGLKKGRTIPGFASAIINRIDREAVEDYNHIVFSYIESCVSKLREECDYINAEQVKVSAWIRQNVLF